VRSIIQSKKALFIVAAVILCLCLGGISYIIFRPRVVSNVTIEAGSPMVDVSEFLLDKNSSGSYITDVGQLDTSKPGTYEIEIQVGKRIFKSQLIIKDTTAPTGTPVDVLVLKGEEINPHDFVKDIYDITEVSVVFSKKLNTRIPGNHDVEIILSDTSKNTTILNASLTVLDVKESIQVEAGSDVSLTTYDFVDHGDWPVSFITPVDNLDFSKPAQHEIKLDINGKTVSSFIHVVDTTPPAATVTDQETYVGQPIEADAFVSNIVDVSDVTYSYKRKPDFDKEGITEVNIVLEDTYVNKTEYTANLKVVADNDPPVFSGIKDITIYEGQSVSYRKNVKAIDKKDGEVSFQVDSSKVNPNKAGKYEVVYTAVDKAGNKAVEKAAVIVKKQEVTKEIVYEMADEILNKITKPGMSKQEVAYQIYKYVRGSIAYTGTSNKSSVIKEAYRGMKNKVGDCFTYYSVSEVLLTRAGIPNMCVTRQGGKTQHFWNLINCGNGWYHFDATRQRDGAETFMMTDADLEEFTRKRGNNYYVFDKSKYPRTPEK